MDQRPWWSEEGRPVPASTPEAADVQQGPATPPPRRGTPRAVVLSVAAAVLVLASAGWAAASGGLGAEDSTATPAPTAPDGQGDGEDDGRGGPMGRGHGMGHGLGLGAGIHGEFTMKDPDGGYQEMATQRGTVTAVSAESLTVKSEDGFTRTYAVTADTMVNAARDGIATVEVGHEVAVVGTLAGDEATAVHVRDVTLRQDMRDRWRSRDDDGDNSGDGSGATQGSSTLFGRAA